MKTFAAHADRRDQRTAKPSAGACLAAAVTYDVAAMLSPLIQVEAGRSGSGARRTSERLRHRLPRVAPRKPVTVPPCNITEFQAQVPGAMGPNRSLQAGSIEPASHENSSPTGVR